MRVATYARYSSDRQREASIEDQFRNCVRLCERDNWDIVARYSDEAISGSRIDRPSYQAMLAAAKAKGFDVLVVDDLSRLSRDDVEMKQLIRRFRFWGLRIIGVSDGFDSNSKGYKIQAGVRGLMNELYLDDLREKTHRGLTGQALKGNNCGGRAYGYRHVAETEPNRLDEYGRPEIVAVRREIDPEQAEIVRRIFSSYADGHAPRAIAAELNRLGVPSGRGGTWAASVIYGDMQTGTGLLNNELYIGRYVWNRSRWPRDPDSRKTEKYPSTRTSWRAPTTRCKL